MNKYPKVSIVIATLNSQRTLDLCLSSISNQDYKGVVEIIIADGGSTDKTVSISKSYKTMIVDNKFKTGESGKAVGVKKATGEIIALIDSDNVLPDKKWLTLMVKPFMKDSSVTATEPLKFTYRKSDSWLTRYFALLGMGDPLNLFIGNYDRYSYVTNKWTNIKVQTIEKKETIEINAKDDLPTIGANGFLIRKTDLLKYNFGDYLFDIDILNFLKNNQKVKIVKVRVGIVHLFSGDITTFVRKQRRRIRDYLYYRKTGLRLVQVSKKILILGIIKFMVYTILVVPTIIQSMIGFFRKQDVAWVFHPVACLLTLYVYGIETIRSLFRISEMSRVGWKQ